MAASPSEMEHSGDRFDVVVVGAGIMGSATAYQLAKRGEKNSSTRAI